MSNTIQKLIDTWEQRPRRQLDYSLLTSESIEDMEWTGRMLQALIPAMREIREKFQLEPTPPIMLEMPVKLPPTRALPVSPEAASTVNGSGQHQNGKSNPRAFSDTPASQTTPELESGAASPSKPALKVQGKGKSKSSQPPGGRRRSVSGKGRKPGNAGKSASADAKPGVEHPSAPPAPAALPTPPAIPAADMSDPPAPTLGPIG